MTTSGGGQPSVTGAHFVALPARMHADIVRAMVKNGVRPNDGDAVLTAYTASLVEFFRGLKKEGHPADRIDGWVDWLAANVKANVNAPEVPGGRPRA